MEKNKNKLSKIALTALVLASSSSVLAADTITSQSTGTFLAAGCGGGKCGAQGNVSWNNPNSNPYNARSNNYQASCSASQRPNNTAQAGCGNARRNASTASNYDSSTNTYDPAPTYNTNRGYNTSTNPNDTYRTYSSDGSDVQANTNMNRNYNTASDYDYQRTGTGMSAMSSSTMNEADLAKQLNSQGKAIWNSLDPEGKALALQLASQESYRDKNMAVKEAQRRINERRGMSQIQNNR